MSFKYNDTIVTHDYINSITKKTFYLTEKIINIIMLPTVKAYTNRVPINNKKLKLKT